jgi:hypothetical protein
MPEHARPKRSEENTADLTLAGELHYRLASGSIFYYTIAMEWEQIKGYQMFQIATNETFMDGQVIFTEGAKGDWM